MLYSESEYMLEYKPGHVRFVLRSDSIRLFLKIPGAGNNRLPGR